MHTKKHILKFITEQKDSPKTPKEVAQIHKYFEAYIKHIALTTLRLHGAKYNEARRYLSHSWIPCNEKNIKKILLKLFNKPTNRQQYWIKIEQDRTKLKNCLDLLYNYAFNVRNQISHGNYYPFDEGEESFLFDLYVNAIEEIEQTIAKKKKGNRILLNTPKEFGAKAGRLEREGQLKNILNFQGAKKGYSYTKAKEIYTNTYGK